VKHQRRSFRPLCELYLIDADLEASDPSAKIIDIVASSFADAGDASSLKKDIVEGKLLSGSQLDVLDHMLTKNGQQLFPMPSSESVGRLAQLWPTQSERLLDLAKRALSSSGSARTSSMFADVWCNRTPISSSPTSSAASRLRL
jgi:hypothetical protein